MSAAVFRPLARPEAESIARHFLPERRFGNRWDYYYSRAKLGSDPLYAGVCDALHGCDAPLLDLGCGLGLLAHALRASGGRAPYRGVDSDVSKLRRARQAAARAGLQEATFVRTDLSGAVPAHRGSVAILDVLQFVPPAAQDRIVDAAIAMLTPGGRLVIRTGLADASGRARITRGVDVFSRVLGWMNSGPTTYPDAEALRARLAAAGLAYACSPLYGDTPFNNWLIVATRER